MPRNKKNNFYAFFVPDSNESGITKSWSECELKVKGVPGARFMGFNTHEEAKKWLEKGAKYTPKPPKKPLEPGIYFDAGTGRGKGVEVNVTDEKGNSLLSEILPVSKITKHETELLEKHHTNNYGELLACFYALKIANKKNIKKVFGDSALVLNYWSKGIIKEKSVAKESVDLAKKTAPLRQKFEEAGGKLVRVSGDNNPADLGFH